MPKCKYCGKVYSWDKAFKKERSLDGCRYYCSRKHCELAYPGDPSELRCPCF